MSGDVRRLVETEPGVFEQARHQYLHHRKAKPGDFVMHREQRDDGTWTDWEHILVIEDSK